ncbi:hypothetical protein PAAG_05180 [Paracoccidioides lutzii Pb01]|uniref:Uncharacterized protein n=1 Tax=Paracoccidioides lutzii (strain ATCC MYA-826 / Pb01) TaxID=502779 RepID=C1H337_PARBA|nr:hypothetical protein PAAG_05180 [Paracoccidioides lutzii Pb01]EEH34131.2 hypothetical protein PAAG_05180 [Paracoccidioides lutzii Pb01]
MLCQRHTSPLHFEPLSPSPSDLLSGFSSSDSGDVLDDASRASRRRKIESLAQDYLEGKPLFILSASLKGPFNNDWVNPWKKSESPKELSNKQQRMKGEAQVDRSGIRVVPVPEPSSSVVKHIKRHSKYPRVHRQGSGFESSSNPEPICHLQQQQQQQQHQQQQQQSQQYVNDLGRKSGKRDRERLETDISSHGQQRSPSIVLSKQRSKSAVQSRISSSQAERHWSAPYRVSKSRWLEKDEKNEKRLHQQDFNRSISSASPTPGYRRRFPRESQLQDRGIQHKRQRVGDLDDQHKTPTPHHIAFTPINGRLHPEEVSSSRRNSKSPGGRSCYPKPDNPGSAFTGHSSRREKEDISLHDKKSSYASAPKSQKSQDVHVSTSLHVVTSLDHHPESQYGHTDKVRSSANTTSSSNTRKAENRWRSQSRGDKPQRKNKLRSKENISHNSVPDLTPEGTHDFQDQDQDQGQDQNHTFNATASGTIPIPSAQLIPEHSRLPNPALSLYSTDFSGRHNVTGTMRHETQNLNHDEQFSTKVALTIAQKSLGDDLAFATGDIVTATEIRKASLQRTGQAEQQINDVSVYDIPNDDQPATNNPKRQAQDGSTRAMLNSQALFDFSTVKRIKPGRPSEADTDIVGKKSKRQRDTSYPYYEPPQASPSNLRIQTQSLSPKSVPFLPNGGQTNDSSNLPHPLSLPRPFPAAASAPTDSSQPNHLSNPIHPLTTNPSTYTDSTILPFNLTSSTTGTCHQDGQGHGESRDNFNLSQAILDAGTFLGSWDFERLELQLSHSHSQTHSYGHGGRNSAGNGDGKIQPPQLSSENVDASGPRLQSILRSEGSGRW